jgi:hypothetical protein
MLRPEDQACRVPGSRGRNTQIFVNNLFIRFIRLIRGLILFWRERGDDDFEARIVSSLPRGSAVAS